MAFKYPVSKLRQAVLNAQKELIQKPHPSTQILYIYIDLDPQHARVIFLN